MIEEVLRDWEKRGAYERALFEEKPGLLNIYLGIRDCKSIVRRTDGQEL